MRRVVFQAVQHILDMLSFKFQESGLHYLCWKLVPRNTDTAAFGTDRVQHEFHQLIQSNPICRIVLCQNVVLNVFPNQIPILLPFVCRADRIRYVFSYFFLLFFSI